MLPEVYFSHSKFNLPNIFISNDNNYMINYDKSNLHIFPIQNKELTGIVSSIKIRNLNYDENIEKIYFIHADADVTIFILYTSYSKLYFLQLCLEGNNLIDFVDSIEEIREKSTEGVFILLFI